MLRAFTRNYNDESSDAGFQFTFFCDICNDGYKSSFVQSDSYKKGGLLRGVGQGVGLVGGLIGGRTSSLGYGAERGADLLSNRYEGRSPAWLKEHEAAFERAQNEARKHFHRCPQCNSHVCDQCWNEDEGLCTQCAPRQQVYVARARAEAMKRNIDDAGSAATVWQGAIESKTTICPTCGKPAGTGNFCNNCGASMALPSCPRCGAKNALTVRFCNNCGHNLSQPVAPVAPPPPPPGFCGACGYSNQPGTKFCGSCGNKLG